MSIFFHSLPKILLKNDAKSQPAKDTSVAKIAHPDSPAFPVGAPGTLKKTRPLAESDFIPDAPSRRLVTTSSKDPHERKYVDPSEQKYFDPLDTPDVHAATSKVPYDLDETGLTRMDSGRDIAQPTLHLNLDDPKKLSENLKTPLTVETGTDDDILNITIDVDPVPAPTTPKKEFYSWTVQLWKHNNVFNSPAKGEAMPEGFDKFKTGLLKTLHLAFLVLVDLVRWISGNRYENTFNGNSVLSSLENSRFNPNRTYSWLKVEENDSKGMRPEGHWLDQMPARSRPSLTPGTQETQGTIVDMPAADRVRAFEDNQKNDPKVVRPENHWLDQMPSLKQPSLTPQGTQKTQATIVDMSSVPSGRAENLTEAWHLRQSAKANQRTSSVDLQSANKSIAPTPTLQAQAPASTVTAQANSIAQSVTKTKASQTQAPASSAAVQVNAVAKPVLTPVKPKLSKEKRQAEIARREKVIKERENQLLNRELVLDRIETKLGKIRNGKLSSDEFDANCQEEGHQLARLATGKTMTLSNGEKYQFDTAETKKILDAALNLKKALNASLNETTYEASSTTDKNGKMIPRKEVDAQKQAYALILSASNDGQFANTLRDSFNESVLREFAQESEENGFVEAYENATLKFDQAFRLGIIKTADENLFLKRVEAVLFSTVLNQFREDYNQTGDQIESTIHGMDTIKKAVDAVKNKKGQPLIDHARVLENFLVLTNYDSSLPKTLIRQEFKSEAASMGLPQALKKAFARIDRASKYFPTQFESDTAWEKRQFFQETAYPLFRRDVLDAALKTAHETAIAQKDAPEQYGRAYAEATASLKDFMRVLDSGELHAKLFAAFDDVDYVQGVREKIQRGIFPELVRDAHLQMVAENNATVENLQLKAAVLYGSGLLAEEAGFVQEVTKLLEKDKAEQNQASLAQKVKTAQDELRAAHDLRMKQLSLDVPAKLNELEAAKKAVSANAEAIEEHANRMLEGEHSARLADLIPNAKRAFNFSTDPKRVGLLSVLNEQLSSSPFARTAAQYLEEGRRLEREKNRLLVELKAKNEEYVETLRDADDLGFRLVKVALDFDIEDDKEVVELIESMESLQAQALEAIDQRYQEISKPSETSAPLGSSLGSSPLPSLVQGKPALDLPLPASGASWVPGLSLLSLEPELAPLALMPPEPEKEESSLPLTGSNVGSHRKPLSLDDIEVDLEEAAKVRLSDADDDFDAILGAPLEKETIPVSFSEEELGVLAELGIKHS